MAPIMAATRANSAASVFPEKSTIPNMVFATAVEMNVMPTRPTKLNTAARPMATFGFRHRVDTAVAMAFGASVAPDTAVTPMMSTKITNRIGWAIACARKSANVNAIQFPIICKSHVRASSI